MKVQNLTPINPVLINKTLYRRDANYIQTTDSNINKTVTTPITYAYYPLSEISFRAQATQQFLNELRGLKDIHCPTCGIKMLNNEEFLTAMKEISSIKTTEEYFSFINKYRSYISPILDKVINSVQKYSKKTPDEPIDSILNIVRGNYIHNYRDRLQVLNEEYKNSEYFSSENPGYKEGVATLISSKKIVSFENFIQYLLDMTKDLPTDIRPVYYKKYLDLVRNSIIRVNVFNFANKEFSNVQNFCRNILKLSSSKTKRLFNNEPADINNTILNCKCCMDITQPSYDDIKESKEFYFQYVYDVARQVLEGELPNYKNYPFLLTDNVEKRLKLVPDKATPALRMLSKELDIKTGKFTQFPLINYEGIHCAYCGSETLTHDAKMDLFAQILATNNIAELSEIVTENARFIKDRNAYIVDVLAKAAQKDSNYDGNLLLNDVKKFVHENIRKTMKESFKEIKIYTNNKISENDKIELANVKKAMYEDFGLLQSYKKSLDQYSYKNKLQEILSRIEDKELKELIWQELMRNIMDLYLAHKVLYPSEELLKKVDNPFKIIVQDMIKDSSLTVDHLDAKGKYKDTPDLYQKVAKDFNNMVISCKSCNQEKNADKVWRWVQKHPEVVLNFQAYLAKIKNIKMNAKDNKLADYNIDEVAERFSKMTRIKLNLIEYFMKD